MNLFRLSTVVLLAALASACASAPKPSAAAPAEATVIDSTATAAAPLPPEPPIDPASIDAPAPMADNATASEGEDRLGNAAGVAGCLNDVSQLLHSRSRQQGLRGELHTLETDCSALVSGSTGRAGDLLGPVADEGSCHNRAVQGIPNGAVTCHH